jgi:hypothetical protein
MNDLPKPPNLPVNKDLTTIRTLTIIIAVLMAIMSLAGFVFPYRIYPSPELVQSFMVNDLINLIIGLPILLGSLWLVKRSRLVGLLFWPGALLYVFYNYLPLLIGVPFGLVTIPFLVIILLSIYGTFDLLKSIDHRAVQEKLSGAVSERLSGWVLVAFGVLFIFRAASVIAEALTAGTSLPLTEISDIVLSVLWIFGGALLLIKKPLGYTGGLGLLFVASALFLGLILYLLLNPLFTGALFVLADVIVILVMGLVCFIPFGLFLRGVLAETSISTLPRK